MRVTIAPAGFKECLDADAVANSIGAGIRRVVPEAQVDPCPLVDGGAGSARLLAERTGGYLVPVRVTGPVGQPVTARFAMLGGDGPRTAFVEMAEAAGLHRVPPERRNPGRTTSRGVGELIRAALETGVERIVVGCGDSGVCDGGSGALQALGVNVLDARGCELDDGGVALECAWRVDGHGACPRLAEVEMVVAVNPDNVLCGRNGVARVFGPQKGASPEQVEQLDAGMRIWADVLLRCSGEALHQVSGGGASGGLAAGLAGVLGAQLVSRFDQFVAATELQGLLESADLVITAEGALDSSTALGKIPGEVARQAKRHGTPVIALCGTIGPDADTAYESGIDALTGIATGPAELDDMIRRAPELIADATARALRMVLVGHSLPAA